MDMQYLEFCYADPFFYDRVRATGTPASGRMRRYRVQPDRDWAAWDFIESGGWLHATPGDDDLPDQGWKIHCSATLENAQRMLAIVSSYCADEGLHFKFLPSAGDLVRANVKYANRGGSGKFITLYPRDNDECSRVLHDLDSAIGGMNGAYILSDLRWNQGPLYLRYGGFKLEFVRNEMDELVPAIANDEGQLVPDPRQPMFTPPAWVELPTFVADQVARMGSASRPESFPYEIDEALHFSNGGGIYLARSTEDSSKVVLKEGRPFAGLAPDGRSAVDRLVREATFLREFDDLKEVVGIRDYFEQSGHHFLVEDYVEGNTLNKEMVMRNPLIRADQTHQDLLEYRDWVIDVLARVESTIRTFHDRGTVYGDLHPNNIMVTPTGDIRFIDFEMAYDVDDEDVVPAGAPGYMANDGRTGVSADMYSLGCMKLGMFLPLTVLIPLDPDKLPQLIAKARELFDLSAEFCDSISANIGPTAPGSNSSGHVAATRGVVSAWDTSAPAGLNEISAGIVRGIWESADFSRSDRIFPGDIRQFSENGFSIAHGACGNLLIDAGTEDQIDRVLDWVEWAVKEMELPSLGFYDGVAGAAYTFRVFGRHTTADRLVKALTELDFHTLTSDVYGGIAGIGMFLINENSERPSQSLASAINRIRSVLAQRLNEPVDHLRDVAGTPTVATGKAGLMFGFAGQALFWLTSYEQSGNDADLVNAQRALDIDLSVCIEASDGSIQVNEGWRVLPYIASGSIGIGLVLLRILEHVDREDYVRTLEGIERNVTPSFSIQSNFFNGRAGFVYFSIKMAESRFAKLCTVDEVERHVRSLGLYAVVRKTGIHFPGEQIMRLSTDWASGSAGVLAVLGMYEHFRFGEAEGKAARVLPMLGIEDLRLARETGEQRGKEENNELRTNTSELVH